MNNPRLAGAVESLAIALAATAGYLLLGEAGLLAARQGTVSSPVWPAAGLALAAVLRGGPAAALGVFAGSWLLNARALAGFAPGAGGAAAAAAGIAAGSALQALVGARLLRGALSGADPFGRVRSVTLFAAATPLVGLLGASAGVGALAHAGLLRPALDGPAWLTWWIGDSVGLLIAAPLVLAWLPAGASRTAEAADVAQASALLCLLLLCGELGFGTRFSAASPYPLSFLPFAALVWLALRLGPRGLTLGAALTTLQVEWHTALGEGPFASGATLSDSLLLSSVYLAAAAITALLLRALLDERRAAQARLLASHEALERRVSSQDDDLWTANAALRVAAVARRDSQRRVRLYQETVFALPVGIAILDLPRPAAPRDWTIVDMNPAGRRLCAEHAGFLADAAMTSLSEAALASDLPRTCADAVRARRSREIGDYRAGSAAPPVRFDLKVFPLDETTVGLVFEDVTAERTAQDALLVSEEELRLMVENISDYAIFRIDPDGLIASWNKGAEQISGYPATEALGRPYGLLFAREEREAAPPDDLLRRAEAAGRAESAGWRRRRDGSRYWTDSVLTALRDGSGRLHGFVKVVRDGTERRRVLTELQDRTEELARSNGELAQFAYVASHDLQEPLRKTVAFAEQLKSRLASRLDDTDRDFMDRLLRSVDGMQALISSLLQLARVSAAPAAPCAVDLGELVRGVAADLDLAVQRAGGKISVGHLPVVTGDPQQLRQLFQNLISNALKFRRPDAPSQVRVAARALRDGRVEVRVEDDGVGFDMRYAQRLFQPFERLHSRKDFPGTGMGLAICHRIVQRHGGSISFASEPDRGTVFRVVLPGRTPGVADACGRSPSAPSARPQEAES